jgi:hypothetical protein
MELEAIYWTTATYDVAEIEKELGIDWKDVGEWWVKWCVLHIVMKDGTQHCSGSIITPSDVNLKRPDMIRRVGYEGREEKKSRQRIQCEPG